MTTNHSDKNAAARKACSFWRGGLWRGGLVSAAFCAFLFTGPPTPAAAESAAGSQFAQSYDAQPGASGKARHRAYMSGGVPVEYLGRESHLPKATAVIRAGSELYGANCARCHGGSGDGAGDEATDGGAITPLPAFLAYTVKRPRAADDYLLWTIAEGGVPFGTTMPAFKGQLTTLQIWQIVEFMRAGFPVLE